MTGACKHPELLLVDYRFVQMRHEKYSSRIEIIYKNNDVSTERGPSGGQGAIRRIFIVRNAGYVS